METKAANDASFKPILDLQKTQVQQLNVLKTIEHLSTQDRLIQAAQLVQEKNIADDDADLLNELKQVNANLLKFGQNVKSAIPSKIQNVEEGDGYGDSAFSFRNVFDIKRGSGGVIDEYLSRKENAKFARTQKAWNEPLPYMRSNQEATGTVQSSASVGGVTASERQEESDELNKQAVKETKEHTRLLSEILAALTGIKLLGSKAAETNVPSQEGGGIGLGSFLPDFGKAKPKGLPSKPTMGMKAAGFMAKNAGKVGAVGGALVGGYEAYTGWQQANKEEQAIKQDIEAKVASGEISQAQAQQLMSEASDATDVKKGAAVGGGAGGAAGAWAGAVGGAKLGGTIGTFIGGPAGTVVGGAIGGVVGGAAGYLAGSGLGKKAGGALVSGYQNVKSFFGFGKKEPKVGAPVTTQGDLKLFPDETKEDYLNRRVPELISTYPENLQKDSSVIQESNSKAQAEYDSLKKKQAETKTVKGQAKVGQLDTLDPGMKVTSDVTEKIDGGTRRSRTAEGMLIAGEMVVQGKELSKKQMGMINYQAQLGEADKIYPKEIMDQYRKQKAAEQVAPEISKPLTSRGDLVYQESTAAEDAKENVVSANKQSSSPSIVSAPTTINANKTQVNNGKPDIRNSESSLNRYMDARYA